MEDNNRTFAELPAALVDDLMSKAVESGILLLSTFQNLKEEKKNYRKQLDSANLLHHESELGYPPIPTTCATDGSYTIERLLSSDLAASAAVAVEGLTPPSETRHWGSPHHTSFVAVEKHHNDTATVIRALMLGRELQLATTAPHDLIMIDGTLTLPIIYFNQALNKSKQVLFLNCAKSFLKDAVNFLESYRVILYSQRNDKQFVGLPKYSTRREIGTRVGWTGEHDDRGLLTLILRPGEYTKPIPLEQPADDWHINVKSLKENQGVEASQIAEDIIDGLNSIFMVYYKPHAWLPALRIEISSNIANNANRLAIVLQGIKHQCATGSMLEPYPIYLADRTVKALSKAIPAVRQVATQKISENYEGDISEVFISMHGYRTESGA